MLKKLKSKTAKDAYKQFAIKLLTENPLWWGKYGQKQKNFKIYKKHNNTVIEVMSYPRFKRILSEWYKGAKTYINAGKTLALGSSLGRLGGMRVERNFRKKVVNWEATRKMWKDTGVRKKLIYHTEDEWIRVGWFKGGKVKNERFYKFEPAEGNATSEDGFKKSFSLANKNDTLLKYKYTFKPFITNDQYKPGQPNS